MGQAKVTEELNHSVDETVQVILMDQQFGPSSVGPAQAQANIRATVDANIRVESSFGLTIIAKLDERFDLSQSYLYLKNKGEVTAKFQLDAVASLHYSSGEVKLFGLDNFPGATFRVPGENNPRSSYTRSVSIRLTHDSRYCHGGTQHGCLRIRRCSAHSCRAP